MSTMKFTLQTAEGEKAVLFDYQSLFAIGYAGRDRGKTLAHIRELEEQLGVPAPDRIPTIFQMSTLLLTQENCFHVVGGQTCGEAEYVILRGGGHVWIGIGSDHTDRELEGQSVPKAKQICPKPIGKELWDYQEIKEHWDSIRVVSSQWLDGTEIAYQEGSLADILPVETILGEMDERVENTGNCVIFSGTVPLKGGFLYGERFSCALIDDQLGRKLSLDYEVMPVHLG